jgi:hypothetical protein
MKSRPFEESKSEEEDKMTDDASKRMPRSCLEGWDRGWVSAGSQDDSVTGQEGHALGRSACGGRSQYPWSF